MSRSSRFRTAAATLLTCALLVGPVGCGDDDGGPRQVGTVLDTTDDEGRRYRQIPEEGAPEAGIVVEPDADPGAGWDIRIRLKHFRLSPPGTESRAVHGRGYAQLFLDGRRLALLRTLDHRLPAARVGRGTHHVTVRLYADDHTVWAVDGKPVEATADLTASGAETASPTSSTDAP
ncbi:hypothetical protein [Streptomyces sp. NPDC052225]|uniref:hypothetical protein n=1 Tax=Streptomyces sp. NPDC052225 TaxID=3154949 RepID=UPI00342635D5